jgi:transcriptional regulator with XRE-family HTH domain
MSNLYKNLKFWLRVRNKTLKVLADELGVRPYKLSWWVNGHEEMPDDILVRISEILNVDVEKLIGEE